MWLVAYNKGSNPTHSKIFHWEEPIRSKALLRKAKRKDHAKQLEIAKIEASEPDKFLHWKRGTSEGVGPSSERRSPPSNINMQVNGKDSSLPASYQQVAL